MPTSFTIAPLMKGYLSMTLGLVQAGLEASVATERNRLAIIAVEVEADVLRTAAFDGLALCASCLDKFFGIGDVEGNQRCGQVLVAMVSGCGRSLLPLTHDTVDTGRVFPHGGKWLVPDAAIEGPEADTCRHLWFSII